MIENPAYGGAYAYGKTCVVLGYQGGPIRLFQSQFVATTSVRT